MFVPLAAVMITHVIMSYHLLCIHDTHPMHLHAIGVPEGTTLLEFEGTCPEEQEAVREQEAQPAGHGAGVEVILECPQHEPSTFVKGKSRSILTSYVF
jgi:hypothetical protein